MLSLRIAQFAYVMVSACALIVATCARAEGTQAQDLLQTKPPADTLKSSKSVRFLNSTFEANYLSNLARNASRQCSTAERMSGNCNGDEATSTMSKRTLQRSALSRISTRLASDALEFSPTLSAIATGKIEFDITFGGNGSNNRNSNIRPLYQLAQTAPKPFARSLSVAALDTDQMDLLPQSLFEADRQFTGPVERRIVEVWPVQEELTADDNALSPSLQSTLQRRLGLVRTPLTGVKMRFLRQQGLLADVNATTLRVEDAGGLLFAELPSLGAPTVETVKAGVSLGWSGRAFSFTATNLGLDGQISFSTMSKGGTVTRLIMANQQGTTPETRTSSLNLAISLPL